MPRAIAGLLAGLSIAGVVAYILLLATNQEAAMIGAFLFFVCTLLFIVAGKEDDPYAGILAGAFIIGIIVVFWKIPYPEDIAISGFLGILSGIFLLMAGEYILAGPRAPSESGL